MFLFLLGLTHVAQGALAGRELSRGRGGGSSRGCCGGRSGRSGGRSGRSRPWIVIGVIR